MKDAKQICKIKGCKRDVYIKKHQLCLNHYQRLRRTGDVGKAEIRTYNVIEPYRVNK